MFSAKRLRFNTASAPVDCYIEINITAAGWVRYETCTGSVVDTYREVGLFLVEECVAEVREAFPYATIAYWTIGDWVTTCP